MIELTRLELSPGQSMNGFVGSGPLPAPFQVPEPAVLALFASGLAGLGIVRRRRKT